MFLERGSIVAPSIDITQRLESSHSGDKEALNWLGLAAATVLMCMAGGCASAPKKQAPIFFPAPPETPRLQFLTHYSEALDIEPAPSRFYYFLTGAEPDRKVIVKPYGLALHDSKLFVCDTILNAIEIFDLKARRFEYFTSRGAGKLGKPVNLAVDVDGTRFVADLLRDEVLVYSNEGHYAGAVGERGSMEPVDVAVTSNRLYIADMKSRRVQVFEKSTRKLLSAIPREPKDASEDLFGPTNLALDPMGRLYVSDSRAFRIQLYDADGLYLRTLGRHGDLPGEFARPKGIATDREGRLYSVDAAAQLVQIFDDEGRLLLYFGEPDGSAAALVLPAKVIIDYDHVDLFRRYAAPDFELEYLVLVSSQYGNRKVMVYGFGHKKEESAQIPVANPEAARDATPNTSAPDTPAPKPEEPTTPALKTAAPKPSEAPIAVPDPKTQDLIPEQETRSNETLQRPDTRSEKSEDESRAKPPQGESE